MLTAIAATVVGCSKPPATAKTRPFIRDEIDAARLERRASGASMADSAFLQGDFRGATAAYQRGINDPDLNLRTIVKRKMASVYEVQGKEKEALGLLREIVSEKENPTAADPLTYLKMLYFAARQKEARLDVATGRIYAAAAEIQRKSFEVIHDPLIEPGSTDTNLFYWLAMEADAAEDRVLFEWAIKQAGKLSDKQWLQVATVLVPTDPARATSILKRLEPKLTGEDKSHQAATMQKIRERDQELKSGAQKTQMAIFDPELLSYVRKFRATGYWVTGKVPKFKLFKAKMTAPR